MYKALWQFKSPLTVFPIMWRKDTDPRGCLGDHTEPGRPWCSPSGCLQPQLRPRRHPGLCCGSWTFQCTPNSGPSGLLIPRPQGTGCVSLLGQLTENQQPRGFKRQKRVAHSWEGRLPNRGIGRTRLRLTGSSLAFISFWSLSTILGCPLTCRFLSPVPHHFLPVYSHVMPPRGPVSVSLFVRIPVILDWGYPNDLTSTWLPLWRPYFQIRSSSCITRL